MELTILTDEEFKLFFKNPNINLVKKAIHNYKKIQGDLFVGNLHIIIEDDNFANWCLLSCLKNCILSDDWNGVCLISMISELPYEFRGELLNG